MKRVAFYFDVVCPYAYLASTQIDAFCAAHGSELELRPFLLGGVFRAIGAPDAPAESMSAPKARMNNLDMQRWADLFGVPLRMPPEHPRRTVLAMRCVVASPDMAIAMRALFHAYWVTGHDIASPPVVASLLSAAGLQGDDIVARAETDAVKNALRARTEEAVGQGIFGAPSFLVETDVGPSQLFWGQDRLPFVAKALTGWRVTA